MNSKNFKRLESIKTAHEFEKTQSSSRMEDYLEIISELVDLKGYATTLDISRYMQVSAPSVTKMLQRLDEGGFLEYEKYRSARNCRYLSSKYEELNTSVICSANFQSVNNACIIFS